MFNSTHPACNCKVSNRGGACSAIVMLLLLSEFWMVRVGLFLSFKAGSMELIYEELPD
jgi:hypothetical protein